MNDSLSPSEIAQTMVDLGAAKAVHKISDLLVRGMLAGVLLAFATCLALHGALQTTVPLVGVLIFLVRFAMIVIVSLQLWTGNFGLVRLTALVRRVTASQVLANWFWVFVGWNKIPVALGKIVGGLLFTGFPLHWIRRKGGADGAPARATKAVAFGLAK